LVFEKSNIDSHKDIQTESDMKKFFSKYATDISSSNKTAHDKVKSSKEQNNLNDGFTAKMIYKGYIDDPRNTDNAWIEAEIWNFHYGGQDNLNDHIPNVINTPRRDYLFISFLMILSDFRLQVNGKKFHPMYVYLLIKALY
jgi:hypothetical protein